MVNSRKIVATTHVTLYNFVLQSQKLHNPWTGDTSFTWRNRSKSDVYAAPTAGGFPYSSTLSREAEKVSLQENLRKEKRGLDNLHLLWMRLDKFNLYFFELKFASHVKSLFPIVDPFFIIMYTQNSSQMN